MCTNFQNKSDRTQQTKILPMKILFFHICKLLGKLLCKRLSSFMELCMRVFMCVRARVCYINQRYSRCAKTNTLTHYHNYHNTIYLVNLRTRRFRSVCICASMLVAAVRWDSCCFYYSRWMLSFFIFFLFFPLLLFPHYVSTSTHNCLFSLVPTTRRWRHTFERIYSCAAHS